MIGKPHADRQVWILRIMAILALLLTIIVLAACDSRTTPSPQQLGPESRGLGAQLGSIGGTILSTGLWATGLGLVARIAGVFFVPILAPFSGFLGDIIEIGIIAAIVGASFVWLSAHTWLVVLACVVTALAWGYMRRATILRWFNRTMGVCSLLRKAK